MGDKDKIKVERGKAYQEGYDAAWAGCDSADNPYWGEDRALYESWSDGYKKGMRDLSRAKQPDGR